MARPGLWLQKWPTGRTMSVNGNLRRTTAGPGSISVLTRNEHASEVPKSTKLPKLNHDWFRSRSTGIAIAGWVNVSLHVAGSDDRTSALRPRRAPDNKPPLRKALPKMQAAAGRSRTTGRSRYRATRFQRPQWRARLPREQDWAGCATDCRRVRITKMTSTWVASNSMNQPVWNNASVRIENTSNNRPKVRKSKIELTGPSTSMKLRMNSISQWRGLSQ